MKKEVVYQVQTIQIHIDFDVCKRNDEKVNN
jgi:hypothetical protein